METNRIFNQISAALGLTSEEKKEWVKNAGIEASKSKINGWSSYGKNHIKMPVEVLRQYLSYISTTSDTINPLVRMVATLLYQDENYSSVETEGLSILITLIHQEHGYTPNNIKSLIKKTKLTRQKFAQAYGIEKRALESYCLPCSSNQHRTMSCSDWEQLVIKVIDRGDKDVV